jgi:hypothetical protein
MLDKECFLKLEVLSRQEAQGLLSRHHHHHHHIIGAYALRKGGWKCMPPDLFVSHTYSFTPCEVCSLQVWSRLWNLEP